jgi:hypothetical protein
MILLLIQDYLQYYQELIRIVSRIYNWIRYFMKNKIYKIIYNFSSCEIKHDHIQLSDWSSPNSRKIQNLYQRQTYTYNNQMNNYNTNPFTYLTSWVTDIVDYCWHRTLLLV